MEQPQNWGSNQRFGLQALKIMYKTSLFYELSLVEYSSLQTSSIAVRALLIERLSLSQSVKVYQPHTCSPSCLVNMYSP